MDPETPERPQPRAAAGPGASSARASEVLIAGIRLIFVLATVSAVVATFANTASHGPVNPFNFFGYFTIQSNLLGSVVLGTVAVIGVRGGRQGPVLQLARASITTYLIVVALVYNTLLSGLSGGVDVAWANSVMHVVFPLYCLADWLLVPDRDALPFRKLWVVEVYPILWCAVVLVRGATDGWVPYPFFDPSHGYPVVLLYVVGIAVAFIAAGAAVFAASRLRLFGSGARLDAHMGDLAG